MTDNVREPMLRESNIDLYRHDTQDVRATFTVDEVIDHLGHGKFQNFVLLVCGLVFASGGLGVLLIAIIGPALQCEWRLSNLDVAWVNTAATLGMLVGAPFCGYFSDIYGRQRVLLLTSCLSLFFSLLCAFAQAWSWMLLLRFVMGIALSSFTQLGSYAFESLPTRTRVRLIFLNFMWSVSGMFCTSIAFATMTYNFSWRWFIIITAMPSFIAILLFSSLPETPRYWVAAKRPDNVLTTLTRIASVNNVPLPNGEIVISKSTNKQLGSVGDLFKVGMRIRTMVFVVLYYSYGLLYFGIVFLAVENLEGMLKGDNATPHGGTVACRPCDEMDVKRFKTLISTNAAELLAAPVAFVVFNRFGGKRTLAGFALLSSALYTSLLIPGYAFVIRLSLVRLLLACSVMSCYTAAPMYFPTRIRGTAAGVSDAAYRTGAFIAPFLAQVLMKTNPRGTICLFVSVLALAGIMTSFLNSDIENSSNKE